MLGNNVVSVDQAALRLNDVEAGLKFFNEVLGFKINFSLQYDGFRVIMLQAGKTAIEMWENRERECDDGFLIVKTDTRINNLEIAVKNLNYTINQLDKHGYRVTGVGSYDDESGRTATVIGPDDIKVQFVERNIFKQLSDKLLEKVRLKYN